MFTWIALGLLSTLESMATPFGQKIQTYYFRSAYRPFLSEEKIVQAYRLVKKLMRLRACSISGALRAVLDSASDLFAFRLLLTEDKAGHSPCPDDCAHDDNAPHILGAYA